MGLRAFAVVLAALVLASCTGSLVNQEADAAARGLYEAMRSGGDLSSDNQLAEEMRTPRSLQRLAQDRALIPHEAPQAVENRSWRFANTAQGATADLIHAYRYADRTVVAETELRKPPGARTWLITAFHLRVEDPDRSTQPPPGIKPDPSLHPQQT